MIIFHLQFVLLPFIYARHILHQQLDSELLIECKNIDKNSLVVKPNEPVVFEHKVTQPVISMIW